MSQQYRYPSSASLSISAIGTNGAPIPTTSIEVGAKDPSGNLQPLLVDSAGGLEVSVINFSPSAPLAIDIEKIVGATPSATNSIPARLTDGTSFVSPATSGNQTTANTSLSTIATNTNRLAGSLSNVAFDYIVNTYITSGNGTGQIGTVVYKTGGSGGTTVATLTLAYDASDRLASVTRT